MLSLLINLPGSRSGISCSQAAQNVPGVVCALGEVRGVCEEGPEARVRIDVAWLEGIQPRWQPCGPGTLSCVCVFGDLWAEKRIALPPWLRSQQLMTQMPGIDGETDLGPT